MLDLKEILGLEGNDLMDRYIDSSERLRRCLESHPPVVALAGNIGFGKSFVTKLLRNFGISSHHERTDDTMLDLYYSDRGAFAEVFQVHAHGKRAQQFWKATELKARKISSCVDRSAYEEMLTFVPALHTMGDLTVEQVETLRKYFNLQFEEGARARKEYLGLYLREDIAEEARSRRLNQLAITGCPPPDIVILLHGNREIAWRRTLKRGAKYEFKYKEDRGKGLPEDLHIALHKEYDNFERNLRATAWYDGPVITLDQGAVDVVSRTGELFLLESIVEALEREHLKITLHREI